MADAMVMHVCMHTCWFAVDVVTTARVPGDDSERRVKALRISSTILESVRPLSGLLRQNLPQYKRQDAAMPVVIHLDGCIDT